MPGRQTTIMEAGEFARPLSGPTFTSSELPVTGKIGWQSNGGPGRGHPARSLPFSLEIPAARFAGTLTSIKLLGVFALHANREAEGPGTLGATVQIGDGGSPLFRQELLNGRHYDDARDLTAIERLNGDGTAIHTVGATEVASSDYRVDLLTIDVPEHGQGDIIRFKDLGSPASFLLFDVFFEYTPAPGCPFHPRSAGIALSEIGPILRLGDRPKFSKALDQLETSLVATSNLDEARGEALTFLAVATAAMLEQGGSRELHLEQLHAAREFENLESSQQIASAARRRAEDVAAPMFREQHGPSAHLVERALALVERNYAKNLTDAIVAQQLGLSTSHFRFLFREATGQPFHRYLVALRLEKAKQMLVEQELPVSAVARAVGFTGLSHFSRAFTQRFSVSPTSIRRTP